MVLSALYFLFDSNLAYFFVMFKMRSNPNRKHDFCHYLVITASYSLAHYKWGLRMADVLTYYMGH